MSGHSRLTSLMFTKVQLNAFKKELKQAGGFDALMLKKEALKAKLQMKYICLQKNIEDYRSKFLIGIYEPLKKYYDTEVPYVFWSAMRNRLSAKSKKKK